MILKKRHRVTLRRSEVHPKFAILRNVFDSTIMKLGFHNYKLQSCVTMTKPKSRKVYKHASVYRE